MTTTLAASVFERLGDELWLLVPAFVFALRRQRAHRARARRAPLVRGDPAVRDRRVGSSAWSCRCGSRPTPIPRRTASAATSSSSRLLGAMAAAVWLEFLARPGVAGPGPDRPAVGAASGPLGPPARPPGAAVRGDHPHRGAQRAGAVARARAQGRRRGRRRPPAGAAPAARARGVRRDVREARAGAVDPHRPHLAASRGRARAVSRTTCAPRRATPSPRCSRRSSTRPVPDVFPGFDWQPIAAASIGQVYRAQLPDGSPVMVKVQRPGIDESVRVDLSVLEELGHVVESRTTWGASTASTTWSTSSRPACARSSTTGSRRATRTPSRPRCPPTRASACRTSTTSSARRVCS